MGSAQLLAEGEVSGIGVFIPAVYDIVWSLIVTGVIAFFFFKYFIAPFFKMPKTLIDTAGYAAIKPNGRTADIFKKTPIMRDQYNG